MTNPTDEIVFLREQIDRNNDSSFFVFLYDFCYFDKKNSQKNPKNLPRNRDRRQKFKGRNFRYFTLYDLSDALSSR